MEFLQPVIDQLTPCYTYIQDFLTEIGLIFTNTIHHDIGLDPNSLQWINLEVLAAALFSVISPFVFVKVLLWCCGSSSKKSLPLDLNKASTSDKYEALRWYQQAEHDYQAAHHDNVEGGAYEWCCMKCQQVWDLLFIAMCYKPL